MGTSHKAIRQKLGDVAAGQHGFFTASQAVDAGYADSMHNYHVQQGDWIKAWRGIYRLADVPQTEHGELTIWSLWSRGRNGVPQGVYSHETALMIHGVLPWKEGALHMTVPSSFRRNSEIPSQIVLHKADLLPEDFEARDGFYVTTLNRAQADASGTHTNPKIEEAAKSMKPNIPWISSPEPAERRSAHEVAGTQGGADDWDSWDGPPAPVPQWSGGKSFDQALLSGED